MIVKPSEQIEVSGDIDTDRLDKLAAKCERPKVEFWNEKLHLIPDDIHSEEIFLAFFRKVTRKQSLGTIGSNLSRIRAWWDYPASTPLDDVNERQDEDVTDYIKWLTHPSGRDVADTYAQDIVSDVARAYEKGIELGYLDAPNPFRIALDNNDLSGDGDDDDANVRGISIPRMGQFVQFLRCPKLQAYVMFALVFLKRAGEIENIDITHIHIPRQWWHDYLDECGFEMEDAVAQHTDRPTIYFSSKPEEGYSYNGEIRTRSVKSREGHVLVIPEIVVAVIHRLIDCRPAYVDTPALFVTQSGHKTGERMTADNLTDRLCHTINRFSKYHPDEPSLWWKEENKGTLLNVTTKYFRHWGTELYRRDMGEATTQVVRGDKGGSSHAKGSLVAGSQAQADDYHHSGETNPDVQAKDWDELVAAVPNYFAPELPLELVAANPHNFPAEVWEGYRSWSSDQPGRAEPVDYLIEQAKAGELELDGKEVQMPVSAD